MSEQWRYRCPEGHTAWVSNSDPMQATAPFYCPTCQRYGLEPHFDKLTDAKTGKRVSGVSA